MSTSKSSNEKPKNRRTTTRKKAAPSAEAPARAPRSARPASSRISAVVESMTKPADSGARLVEPPTSEQIAVRAFQIWEEKGRPDGQQMDNWLQAENELRQHTRV